MVEVLGIMATRCPYCQQKLWLKINKEQTTLDCEYCKKSFNVVDYTVEELKERLNIDEQRIEQLEKWEQEKEIEKLMEIEVEKLRKRISRKVKKELKK